MRRNGKSFAHSLVIIWALLAVICAKYLELLDVVPGYGGSHEDSGCQGGEEIVFLVLPSPC